MELRVQKREIFGKRVKSLRKGGFVPAELYGHGIKNIHLNVPKKEFSKIFKEAGESTLVNIVVEGAESEKLPVLIHDVLTDPIKDDITHIDFYQVRMDEKIQAAIPLEFIGEAPAVKEKGGVLVKAMHEIEVEALPIDLPHTIKVDLGKLIDIKTSVHVKDLEVLKGVKLLVELETVIATIIEQAKEEEVVKGPTSVDEVKVEGKEEAGVEGSQESGIKPETKKEGKK